MSENDVASWREQKADLDHELISAERAISRARAQGASATEVVELERRIAELHADAAGVAEQPRGWRPIARETSILEILRAPLDGDKRTGFAKKEESLRAELAQLSLADSRTLKQRLQKNAPDDPISSEVNRMIPARRQRVLAFLEDARRRDAARKTTAPKDGAVSTVDLAASSQSDPQGVGESTGSIAAPAIERRSGAAVDPMIASSVAHHTGVDVSSARVHTDSAAQQANESMGSRAFASSNDVFLGRGESSADPRLMGHELAHVAQQRQGAATGLQRKGGGAVGVDGSLEAHADVVGEKVAADHSDGKHDGPAGADGSPPLVKPHGARYSVFAETDKPYKIVSAKDPVQFWIVNDWIRAGTGFAPSGSQAFSPACAAEILHALGWVSPNHIDAAAKHLSFDLSRPVAKVTMAASAFAYTGMPSGKPIVSRAGAEMVQVATQLANPDVPAHTRVEIDDDQRLEMIRALSAFTGLQGTGDALAKLSADPRFQVGVVEAGVLLWSIDAKTGDEIFGADPSSKHGGRFSQWLHAKPDAKSANEADNPKLKLSNYYGQPVPGKLTRDRELVEAGTPVWVQVPVKWPANYPSANEYDVVPMVEPGYGGNVAALSCEWVIEPSDGSGAVTVTSDTTVGELHHAFVLPEGRKSGSFKVTVHTSFPEYFEPATFEMVVPVKSTVAAMEELGGEAFGDLGASDVRRTPESFDVRGSGDDKEGSRTSGQLPATFEPTSLDTPDSRSDARIAERKRLEAVRMYMQAHGAKKDVLDAIDHELSASRATEAALQDDRKKGYQPFQIRGTYLSRTDGVPSGALTLYGTVRTSEFRMEKGRFVPGGIVVQIRDLSRRFDNADMMTTGIGATFEEALKAAFLDNAKAYPTGVMEIEAEAIDADVVDEKGEVKKSNGRTIGFQLGTDSMWKRAKQRVFSPIANIATNLAAMALMAFVPGSATVVAPLLIAYNTAPTVDRLRTDAEHGTLSFGTVALSVGEIALNLLPLAGKAKPFTKGWWALETANWGGQAILMRESAKQVATDLQAQDAEVLSSLYEEMQKLEASGADPGVIEAKRQQVMERAKKVSERIDEQISEQVGRFALLAVAGSVIHRAGTEVQRADLVDKIAARQSGESSKPQVGNKESAVTIEGSASHHPAPGAGDRALPGAEAQVEGGETGGAHTKRPEEQPRKEASQHEHDATRHKAPSAGGSNSEAAGEQNRGSKATDADTTHGANASESKQPVVARNVATDHPELTRLGGLPLEVMFGPSQHARVASALEGLSSPDYDAFNRLSASLNEPIAKAFLYKGLVAGNGMPDLHWLAAEIAGKDRGWLIDHLTLGDPRGVGGGVKQQWSTSCNASMTITLRGNYDPVFALRLRMRNAEVGEVDVQDPNALNMNQADLEKSMLESPYTGNHPASPKQHKGVATPRVSQGTGRYADDLVNAQSGATHLSFKSIEHPTGTQVVAVLERALPQGMQVPLVIGDMASPQAHYVLAQLRREVAGDVEYNIHDPGSGESTWIRASDIANDSIPGAYHKVGTVEEPTSTGAAQKQPTATKPPASTAKTPNQPSHGASKQPQGSQEAAPIGATKTTDLGEYADQAPAIADRMSKAVAPAKAGAVRDVELRSLASDAQMEAGLRVMDPVFGSEASTAFKESVKASNPSAVDAVQIARDDAMHSMIGILRDPRLNISARRNLLLSELAKYESALNAQPAFEHNKPNFAEARAQVLSLKDKIFDQMLTVDEAGTITQAGKSVGTLSELMETVKSANAALRERKIAKEFAISVSTPVDPRAPREVKILARVPEQTTAAAASKIVHPLENVDGVVVDIGVGLGSFARDAAQEKGPLVQTEYGPKYADAALSRRDLTWENTGPRTDVDSVLVLGDSLQTLPMMFAPRSVKRLFVNNINAHYKRGGSEYTQLAAGLRKVMAVGGRVEVQWTNEAERGHVTGDALAEALDATASTVPRTVSPAEDGTPVTDFHYSVEASRYKKGATKTGEAKKAPPDPIPTSRAIFTFGE